MKSQEPVALKRMEHMHDVIRKIVEMRLMRNYFPSSAFLLFSEFKVPYDSGENI